MIARRLATLTFITAALLAQNATDKPIAGFTSEHAKQQTALEERFDATLRRSNLQSWMKRISSRPHHLGSPYGKEVAEFIASQFKSWGYDTHIETFYPLFPTPKTRVLEMIAPEHFTAKLSEPAIAGDSTSSNTAEGLPVYNAYSIDGDVTAPLVYVNYGLPKDYEKLAEMGVDVKGKIVIARYGASWRGIKPKVAAEHGAVGCIIYSDPKDDGYYQGEDYPQGGWRPPYSAQRGSVMDMPTYPGDPLTPGVGATKDVKRPPYKSAETLTKIPVLPISYADAEPMLKALGGSVAPETWRGALPFTYHMGPGPAKVHLKLEFNWNLAPAYDVIARLEGAERPDEWIIRGNHHDAWVFGASDPVSALVAMMEEARGVSELVKSGWHPKRTIIYAAWDGEEPALLGSTEWAETHAEELQKHAAFYVNSDVTGRGFLAVGGSQTLGKLVNDAARDIPDPQRKVSVLDRYRAFLISSGSEEKAAARDKKDISIHPLGSGSDYTPFLQHLGIASLDIRFGGESNSSGSYHSNYDSYDHFTKFEDPDFQYTYATSQLGGRIILRLADADVLPLRFGGFTQAIGAYITQIQKLADDLRAETKDQNDKIADHSLELAADPRKPFVLPEARVPVPYLNFAVLQNALVKLQKSSDAFAAAQKKLDSSSSQLTIDQQKALDLALMQTERTLISDKGLPRRPWYRHQVYAPGYYTGYGVKTIPGVREAVEERNWTEASEQLPAAAGTLERMAEQIDRCTAIINGGLR